MDNCPIIHALLSLVHVALVFDRSVSLHYAPGMAKGMAVLLAAWCICLPLRAMCAVDGIPPPGGIPAEDYALYDQVVEQKFLTPHTQLVVLERMTVTRLLPDQTEPTTDAFFQERNYFMGLLPPDLVRDFVGANREAGRLERRFRFGVRYRFLSADSLEEQEAVSAWPVRTGSVLPMQASSMSDRLAFSRVGRTLRDDQALLYVEHHRPDETGAGFLVWFHRQKQTWTIYDTDVVWVIRSNEEAGEESP